MKIQLCVVALCCIALVIAKKDEKDDDDKKEKLSQKEKFEKLLDAIFHLAQDIDFIEHLEQDGLDVIFLEFVEELNIKLEELEANKAAAAATSPTSTDTPTTSSSTTTTTEAPTTTTTEATTTTTETAITSPAKRNHKLELDILRRLIFQRLLRGEK